METRNAFILASDIDRTLTPGYEDSPEAQQEAHRSLHELHDTLTHIKHDAPSTFFFGTSTGRNPLSHRELEAQNPTFGQLMTQADFKNTSVGTRILLRESDGSFRSLADWPQTDAWDHHTISDVLSKRTELIKQADNAQDEYKVSFNVYGVNDRDTEQYTQDIKRHLGSVGITADAIFSAGQYLDIVPPGINKGSSLHHTIGYLALRHNLHNVFSIAGGDSMNDANLLAAADLAIIPSNAYPSLRTWAQKNIPSERLYIARTSFARSILECLEQLRIT